MAAIGIDYVGPVRLRRARAGSSIRAYFAERYGLIVIIALGESIVATGVGAEGIRLDARGGRCRGPGVVAVAAALWWAYFDVVAPVAERRLRAAAPGRAAEHAWRATPTRTCTCC